MNIEKGWQSMQKYVWKEIVFNNIEISWNIE
jgi:hypothetical protein